MTTPFEHHVVPLGIDILGLNAADQARIRQIGLWAWMDEIAQQFKSKRKPSRLLVDQYPADGPVLLPKLESLLPKVCDCEHFQNMPLM
jgi:hypothetical protein